MQVTLLTRSGRRQVWIDNAAFWGDVPSTIPNIIGAIQDVLSAVRGVSPP